MDIEPIDVSDDQAVDQLLALERAAHAADRPDRPPACSVEFRADPRHPHPGHNTHRRAVRDGGRIVGQLTVALPTRDNRHLAEVSVVVHPEHRRRGLGRALMAAGDDIAREAGRRTVVASTLVAVDGGPARPQAGARFLESLGFRLALTDLERRADLTALDPDVEQQLYAEASARAEEAYEILPWTVRVPEELLAGVARLDGTFLAEAPSGELEVEAENLDADYIRDHDDARLARGLFMCGVVARHRGSGEIVANTVIGVPTEPGDVAGQSITLVASEHRGHRLGLLVKLTNHRQLRRERPQVRWVYTGNADVNAHMIAINEQLGFQAIDARRSYQRNL